MLVLFGNETLGPGMKNGNGMLDQRTGFNVALVRQLLGSSFPACNPPECRQSRHCPLHLEGKEKAGGLASRVQAVKTVDGWSSRAEIDGASKLSWR